MHAILVTRYANYINYSVLLWSPGCDTYHQIMIWSPGSDISHQIMMRTETRYEPNQQARKGDIIIHRNITTFSILALLKLVLTLPSLGLKLI